MVKKKAMEVKPKIAIGVIGAIEVGLAVAPEDAVPLAVADEADGYLDVAVDADDTNDADDADDAGETAEPTANSEAEHVDALAVADEPADEPADQGAEAEAVDDGEDAKKSKRGKGSKKEKTPKWLHAKMKKSAAEELVGTKPDGRFLVRDDSKGDKGYVVTVAFKGKCTHHAIATNPDDGVLALNGARSLSAVRCGLLPLPYLSSFKHHVGYVYTANVF